MRGLLLFLYFCKTRKATAEKKTPLRIKSNGLICNGVSTVKMMLAY